MKDKELTSKVRINQCEISSVKITTYVGYKISGMLLLLTAVVASPTAL